MTDHVSTSGRATGLPTELNYKLLVAASLFAVALAFVFLDGLVHAVASWEREEFSYGYIVPPLTALLVWHALREMRPQESGGSWWGVGLIVFAAALAIPAKVGGMPTFTFYGFIVALYGLALTLYGWHGMRRLLFPIAYLIFALPLPATLYVNVSTTMQLISSVLGTEALRALGYSVFLNGNIIDLGLFQLQVAEACNGLRYLFPLASFAYLTGYLYRGPVWHRIALFIAVAPITIVINSARISLTGILVNYKGISAAEGFMHAFEGWVIFVVGLLFLFAFLQVLIWVTGHREAFVMRLDIDKIMPKSGSVPTPVRASSNGLIAATIALLVSAVTLANLPEGAHAVPDRKPLAAFPLQLGTWSGREQVLDQIYLDILQVDDYIVADYSSPDHRAPVNLYVAWYDAQDQRASIHSPEVCIPAGGWEITHFDTRSVAPATVDLPLNVNRAIIVNGVQRQLVYYWFELRHRQMTSEFTIKLANVWDAITLGRTDGALVRLVTPIAVNEDVAEADARLMDFLGESLPTMADYMPD